MNNINHLSDLNSTSQSVFKQSQYGNKSMVAYPALFEDYTLISFSKSVLREGIYFVFVNSADYNSQSPNAGIRVEEEKKVHNEIRVHIGVISVRFLATFMSYKRTVNIV